MTTSALSRTAGSTGPITDLSMLVDLIEDAGLSGRGGALFSTATKLRAAMSTKADLVVNACDGEIGAAKDGWIVAHRLPELLAGARAVRPHRRSRIVIAAHRGSRAAQLLQQAPAPDIELLEVPARYVSSEESALVSLLHGGPAKPMTKSVPFVYGGRDTRGRRVRPTLVLNAETVWRIAQIAQRGTDGPAWFRSHGTTQDPGPRLVTIAGYVARPGVAECAAGARLGDLLDLAGGALPGAQYVLVGGLGGVLLTLEEAHSAVWSRGGMAPFGGRLSDGTVIPGTMGAGVVTVLDPGRCPLDVVGEFIAYGAGESAGQCGPCMFGLPSIAQDWMRLTHSPDPATVRRLRERLGLVRGRGACHHPDGVARFAASALHALEPHLLRHEAECTGRAAAPTTTPKPATPPTPRSPHVA